MFHFGQVFVLLLKSSKVIGINISQLINFFVIVSPTVRNVNIKPSFKNNFYRKSIFRVLLLRLSWNDVCDTTLKTENIVQTNPNKYMIQILDLVKVLKLPILNLAAYKFS